MKKIQAVIRPEKLEMLRVHLEEVDYPGMMVDEIKGHGKQRGVTHQWRGTEYKEYFLPKTRIEMVVRDEQVKPITDAILKACRTEAVGDGKIFITAVEEVIRIRTGEKGNEAL